jgi:hypothetical protein
MPYRKQSHYKPVPNPDKTRPPARLVNPVHALEKVVAEGKNAPAPKNREFKKTAQTTGVLLPLPGLSGMFFSHPAIQNAHMDKVQRGMAGNS